MLLPLNFLLETPWSTWRIRSASEPEVLSKSLTLNSINEAQWQKPFLLQADIIRMLERTYAHNDLESADASDRFRLLMICAIATVPLRRRGLVDLHPYSFFSAACRLADDIPLLDGIEALQNLLLIARFGVYFHIGT
jgi:hypothetical protein